MSSANIKLAQDAYAAFGKGDIPAILDMMTADVTIGIVGRKKDAPFFGIHTGKADAAEFFKLLDEAHALPLVFERRVIEVHPPAFLALVFIRRGRRQGFEVVSGADAIHSDNHFVHVAVEMIDA